AVESPGRMAGDRPYLRQRRLRPLSDGRISRSRGRQGYRLPRRLVLLQILRAQDHALADGVKMSRALGLLKTMHRSAISTAHQLSTTTLYPLRGAEQVSPCQTPANPEEH